MTPQISVLFPYRDAAATIEEAAASVLAERDVDLELIAIDDGSSDASSAIVERIAKGDGRVTRLSTEGVGIARALALGLEVAKAPIIGRMDADDISLPSRFLLQIEAISRSVDVAVVGTQVEAFPSEVVGEGLRRYVAWQNALVTPEEHARAIFVESPLCHPSVLIRKDALVAVGGFCARPWPEDYDLWLRLDAAGHRFAKVPRVLLRWRHSEGRATFRGAETALGRFVEARGHYLAPRLTAMGRPVAIWGAGRTGRRLARALALRGLVAVRFIDIDPKKIGRRAQDAPIVAPTDLSLGDHTIVVAVGARGARDLVRAHLDERGFREGVDYVCAA